MPGYLPRYAFRHASFHQLPYRGPSEIVRDSTRQSRFLASPLPPRAAILQLLAVLVTAVRASEVGSKGCYLLARHTKIVDGDFWVPLAAVSASAGCRRPRHSRAKRDELTRTRPHFSLTPCRSLDLRSAYSTRAILARSPAGAPRPVIATRATLASTPARGSGRAKAIRWTARRANVTGR